MTEPSDRLKLVEPPSRPVDPLVGKVLDGRYEVEGVLGEGGMGLVYKARHISLNKALAIKVLRAEVSKDNEIVQRFKQEAQSATAIGNEHIIDISDFGVLDEGSTYFVMEFLDGVSLTDAILPEQPLAAARTYHITMQLCRALGAAHAEGIVHRDLKPDNIFLIRRGGDTDFVKVLDFGIAKVGGGNSKLTQAGQVFGTPHYMSPEQCQGSSVDHRTDIYALGVIMYEMASSRVPFDADNLMGILTKHLYEEPIAPHELPPPTDVPAGLEAIILKCLAKQADHRYQSMQELYDDLAKASAGGTPGAVMDRVSRASSAGSDARAQRPSGLTIGVGDLPGARRGKSGLLVGLLAAVLALGGLGAYLTMGAAEESSEPEVQVQAPPVETEPELGPAEPPPVEVPTQPAAAEPQEEAAEDPPVPVRMVKVVSVPAEAEVYRSGSLIGTTPFEVPKPDADEVAFEVELRARGYEDQMVRISRFTQDNLKVRMKKERSRPRRKAPRAEPEPKPVQQPKPASPAPVRQRRGNSEVLDPWS